jgi:branched-chain amino acid transport system substrate-binding protein
VEGLQGQSRLAGAGSEDESRALAEVRRGPVRHGNLDPAAGNPSLIYSSLWGGDLQAFVLQAAPRGLMKDRFVVLSASDHVLPPLGNKMPDGVIVGARGSNGQFAEKSPINDWYVAALATAYPGLISVQPHYRAAQGLLGLKTAVEKSDGC